MSNRFVWNIAAPMIGLGTLLLGFGVFAAYNVHRQQQTSSELIRREVSGMLAIEELHLAMREIRYQVNLFLRTHDQARLADVANWHEQADEFLNDAKSLARTARERELISIVDSGYQHFFSEFQLLVGDLSSAASNPSQPIVSPPSPPDASQVNVGISPVNPDVSPKLAAAMTHLSDEVLTNEVLRPLRECIHENQQVVERTDLASQQTAQHLKIGFLLLGSCGGAAGLLMGTVIARAVGRSIVQLNVSIRGVAGRLSDVTGPVSFSHTSDLAGIESGLRKVEEDIAEVVERLQQRELEVLRTEQLARVGQLAAGLAHELRNPLMPMKMLVQSAIERGDANGLKGRSLHVLNDEITRMEKSIQTFLDFARLPTPEKKDANLVEFAAQTIELVQARADRQSTAMTLQSPAGGLIAYVDPTQFRQLLLNLLLNALDVLREGGAIDVELLPQIPPPATVDSTRDVVFATGVKGIAMTEHDALRLVEQARSGPSPQTEAWFALRVSDNGPGIPRELRETLFDPFVTSKESGLGLGLSICQRIAVAHQGTLDVVDRPGGGATFELRLPYGNLPPADLALSQE